MSRENTLRFALPPSVGAEEARGRGEHLRELLSGAVGRPCEVTVASSYAELARELVAGNLDAAWAPPFVCARVEQLGLKVLVRGVRNGSSSFRAALLGRKDDQLTLERLTGKRAAWTDRNSVAGYLLALALLRARGEDPSLLFGDQQFVGSYRAALEAVVDGRADLTSIFAPPASAGRGMHTGVEEIAPEWRGTLSVIAFTEESPTDGVAASAHLAPHLAAALERAFLAAASAHGAVLRDIFKVERFEVAPPSSYRALYKVALASV